MSRARTPTAPPAPWLFCHVPKTAGTSFRAALGEVLPAQELLLDYGRDKAFTSADLEARLKLPEEKRDWRVLAGHVSLRRYASLFDPRQVIAFLRDPLQQLYSHHQHHQRRFDDPRSLAEFALSPAGAGLQRRMLGEVPVQLLGFVGLTEQYADSLKLLAQSHGLLLPARHANSNPNKSDSRYPLRTSDLPGECREAIHADQRYYIHATRVLRERLRFGSEQPWVHGAVTALSAERVEGLALAPIGETRPLALEVRVDGEHVGLACTGYARDLPLGMRLADDSRPGFVFHFPRPLPLGARVDLYAWESGQWLDAQELRARGPVTPPMRRRPRAMRASA